MLNSIAIYDDRVEIGNPGIFPSQITPENIKEPHDSYPYNVKMAEALYRSMWLENWGSGAKRIIEACQEQGVEEPTWRWDGAFVYVTFKRPSKSTSDAQNESLGGSTSNVDGKNDTPNDTVNKNDTVNDTVNKDETLNETAKSILHAIIDNPHITYQRITDSTSIPRATVARHVAKLVSKGYIVRRGADKNGYWELTEKS